MDEPVQYGITEDHFDAVAVADGVLVRMSDNVARVLADLSARLVRFLEDGETGPARRGLRRRNPARERYRQMFPDAYADRAAAEDFRRRQAASLRDTGAVHRVHARCVGDTAHVLPLTEVDDWLVTMALARFLELSRRSRELGMTGAWIIHVQECLVAAVNPRLVQRGP